MSASTASPMEYLGTARGSRLPRRLVAAVLAVVVALALIVVAITELSRRAANNDMSTALASAQVEARTGAAGVQSTLTYAQPMIWSTLWPADVRAGLRVLVEERAAEVSARLAAIHADVEAVRILPWQPAQDDARAAVLAYVEQEQARFETVAADARSIGEALGQPVSSAVATEALRASGADAPSNR